MKKPLDFFEEEELLTLPGKVLRAWITGQVI
jgi:hypothetical protein